MPLHFQQDLMWTKQPLYFYQLFYYWEDKHRHYKTFTQNWAYLI